MSEIQQNRYDQVLRRVAGLVGPGSKVSDAVSDLLPTIDVEQVPGELLLLGGTRICFGSAVVDGAGGLTASIRLINPAGSGVLISITSVMISVGTSQPVVYGVDANVAGFTAQLEGSRDSRNRLVGLTTGQVVSDIAAFGLPAFGSFQVTNNTPVTLEDRNNVAVLAPETSFFVEAGFVDTRLNVTYFWRERTAEQSELNV